MLRLLGDVGCSRCEMVKNILKNKGLVEGTAYTYEHFSDLPLEEQTTLKIMAQEKKLLNMPLILKDNILIDMKEI